MSASGKVLEKLPHIFMNQGVVIQQYGESIQLLTGGKDPIYQQVGRFNKR